VVVENGAKFYTKGAQTYVGGYFGSFGAFNNIQVTGNNSPVGYDKPNTNTLYFGYNGDGNMLTISDGGRVNADYFYNSTSSNSITVAGSNSLLNIGYYFGPGNGGYDNRIIVYQWR